jgi:hypothetical protein
LGEIGPIQKSGETKDQIGSLGICFENPRWHYSGWSGLIRPD